jgi:hypothetical protein
MAITTLSFPTRTAGASTGYVQDVNTLLSKLNEVATAMSVSTLSLTAALNAGNPAADMNTMVAKLNEVIGAVNNALSTGGAALPLNFVNTGDSITKGPDKGTGSNPAKAPGRLAADRISSPAVAYTNMGWPGQTLRWFLDNHWSDVTAAKVTGKRNAISFAWGANDIDARGVSAMYDDFTEAVNKAVAAGYDLILFVPIMDRTDRTGFDAKRLAFNQWMHNTLPTLSSKVQVANESDSPEMFASGAPKNASGVIRFDDDAHPSVRGSYELGEGTLAEGLGLFGGIILKARTVLTSTGGVGATPLFNLARTTISANAVTSDAGIGDFSGIANSTNKLSGKGTKRWVLGQRTNGCFVGLASSRTANGSYAELAVGCYYDVQGTLDIYQFGTLIYSSKPGTTNAQLDFVVSTHPTDATKYACQVMLNDTAYGPLLTVNQVQLFHTCALGPQAIVTAFDIAGALVANS